jgi:D-arabinose 1-dehydrogenase-like Zn-dependent alcohol dehydrogenase
MIKCPNCGAPMQGNICEYCHYTETTKSCNDSEATGVNNSYTHGDNVNVRINPSHEAAASPKDKTVALLLCIFFGVFGAHRFYVGQSKMGKIYLFTMGLLFYGVIIDIFLIVFGKFNDSDGLPLK